MDAKFVKEAKAAGLVNLKGTQNCRRYACKVSTNAMPKEGVEALVAFMKKIRGGKMYNVPV